MLTKLRSHRKDKVPTLVTQNSLSFDRKRQIFQIRHTSNAKNTHYSPRQHLNQIPND